MGQRSLSVGYPERDLLWKLACVFLIPAEIALAIAISTNETSSLLFFVIAGGMIAVAYVLSKFRVLRSAFVVPYLVIANNLLPLMLGARRVAVVSITPFAHAQTAQRATALFIGAQLAVFFVLFALGQRKKKLYLLDFERWLFVGFCVILGVVSLVIGLSLQNLPVYLIGDLYKLLAMPLMYFCVLWTVNGQKQWHVIQLIILAHILFRVPFLVNWGETLAASGGYYSEGYTGDVVLFMFLLSILANQQCGKRIVLYAFLSAAVLLTIIADFSRWQWFATFLAIFVSITLKEKKASYIKHVVLVLSIFVALCLFIASVLYLAGFQQLITSFLDEAWTEILGLGIGRVPDDSIMNRIYELRAIANEFRLSPNLFIYLVGFGSGAQLAPPVEAAATYERLYAEYGGYVHNVHNTYITVLFRMGVIGFAVFAISIVKMVRFLYMAAKDQEKRFSALQLTTLQFVLLYVLSNLFMSIFGFQFIGDLEVAALLGVASVVYRSVISQSPQLDLHPSTNDFRERRRNSRVAVSANQCLA